MSVRERLGKYWWYLKESLDGWSYVGGSGPIWGNPETHPSELVGWMKENNWAAPDIRRVAELFQLQKIGRSFQGVVVARFILSPDGKWESVAADAQPIQPR